MKDVLVAGGRGGLLDRLLDPVADEHVARPTRLLDRQSISIREDEDGRMERWLVGPRLLTDVEHGPAHDVRADPGDLVIDHLRARVGVAALHADALTERRERELPSVHALVDRPSFVIYAANDAVERHAHR